MLTKRATLISPHMRRVPQTPPQFSMPIDVGLCCQRHGCASDPPKSSEPGAKPAAFYGFGEEIIVESAPN